MTDFYDLETKKARIAHIREQIATKPAWALRALSVIYANQTADEQATQQTKHENGIGFTGADAEILTSFAQQYERRGSLSPKQMTILHKRMPKYAKQLEGVAR